MEKRTYSNKMNNSGFTLVEVLISILILSIIVTSATTAFVYASRISKENKLSMTAMNLANSSVEYIRSLDFAAVGTKVVIGGVTIYGDPSGNILQSEPKTVDGIDYTVETTISWEEQGGWDLGDTDWDYKSVKITVYPTDMAGDPNVTKVIETFVARDSSQPALTGANISLRLIRGWNTVPGTKVPVSNAKVKLTAGPSAPRQVQTSSGGVARFIDLAVGNYTVSVDPNNLGMILHPDQAGPWTMDVANGKTESQEYLAEYPCSLRVILKDMAGNPLNLAPGVTGTIMVDVPYGTDINKDFTAANVDSSGYLPGNFITGLWPVGDGYSGAYTITDVLIDQCQYLGSYERNGTVETFWSGKFDAPGTCKEITCYFGTIPVTPSGITTNWVGAGNIITTGYGPYTANNEDGTAIEVAEFISPDTTQSIIMDTGTASDYYASAIYFENTGTASLPGLYIRNRANLILHTGLVVIRGVTQFQNSFLPADGGKITLSTTFEDGSPAAYIDDSLIGAVPGVFYGKLYLAEPVVKDGTTILEPGGYYYYNGLVLPDNISELIPITKDNYID